MPEGHTIHHLAAKLDRTFAGHKVKAWSPQGRFEEGAAIVDQQVLTASDAKGKHAFIHFASGHAIHIHLGLFGRTRFHRLSTPPRGQVRLRLEGRSKAFDLVGPTCCEVLDAEGVAAVHHRLGPDPLRPDADVDEVIRRFGRTRRSVGAVLMDQATVAGVGNVYRSELLFLSGIDPATPANRLEEGAVRTLWANATRLLEIGVKHNQIRVFGEAGVLGPAGGEHLDPQGFTVRGKWGPRQDRLWVYKRRECKVCGTPIVQSAIANRKVYRCPGCQPSFQTRSPSNVARPRRG